MRSLADQWVAERKMMRLVTAPDFLRELLASYVATQMKQGEAERSGESISHRSCQAASTQEAARSFR